MCHRTSIAAHLVDIEDEILTLKAALTVSHGYGSVDPAARALAGWRARNQAAIARLDATLAQPDPPPSQSSSRSSSAPSPSAAAAAASVSSPPAQKVAGSMVAMLAEKCGETAGQSAVLREQLPKALELLKKRAADGWKTEQRRRAGVEGVTVVAADWPRQSAALTEAAGGELLAFGLLAGRLEQLGGLESEPGAGFRGCLQSAEHGLEVGALHRRIRQGAPELVLAECESLQVVSTLLAGWLQGLSPPLVPAELHARWDELAERERRIDPSGGQPGDWQSFEHMYGAEDGEEVWHGAEAAGGGSAVAVRASCFFDSRWMSVCRGAETRC